MPDNQEKLWLRYPFRFVLCFAAGVGLGIAYSKNQVDQSVTARDSYKIDSEKYKNESEERGKKLVLIQKELADERRAGELVKGELAQAQRDVMRLKDKEPQLDQAKRDLVTKMKQVEQFTAEIAGLKSQLAGRSSSPRPVRVDDAARPILSILYKDGSRTFETLRKTLELSDGTLRFHLMELQKSGLVTNKALQINPEDIYSAQLTMTGLKYARDNGFD